jgi:DNA repair protein RecO (recombination protein O)
MSHTKYQTEGIVLGGYDFGEANRYFNIFTKDFGLIGARAQGIRELKSKLRYNLQDLSYSKISLIRGKSAWKITDAQEIKNIAGGFSNNVLKMQTSVRALSFLRRMLSGEGRNNLLFDIIINGLSHLEKENLSEKDIGNLEILLVLRVLNNLGYLNSLGSFSDFIKSPLYTKDLLENLEKVKIKAVKEINYSIEASQL